MRGRTARMPITTGSYALTATSRRSATEVAPSAANDAVEWVPVAFVTLSATERSTISEDAAWADLAAHARASWAKDNPF